MSYYLKDTSPAHDYLDDLESFLYLLAYIFLCYKPDGTPIPRGGEGPSIVWSWADDSADDAYSRKSLLFGGGGEATRALRLVEAAWGPVCGKLFDEFCWWVFEKRDEKDELLGGSPPERAANPLEHFHSHRDEHYAQVLHFFDKAINALLSSPSTPTSIQDEPFSTSESDFDIDVSSPLNPSIPAPPTAPGPGPCRRSARIRDLRLAKGQTSPTQPSKTLILIEPEQPAAQLRRSARLQKRRREEEDQLDAPPPKAKRVKKGLRVTTRGR